MGDRVTALSLKNHLSKSSINHIEKFNKFLIHPKRINTLWSETSIKGVKNQNLPRKPISAGKIPGEQYIWRDEDIKNFIAETFNIIPEPKQELTKISLKNHLSKILISFIEDIDKYLNLVSYLKSLKSKT